MSELSQLLDEKPDEQEEDETLPEEVTTRPVAWYRREYFGFPVWLYAAGIAALAAVLVWVLSDDSVTAPQTGSFLMEEHAEPDPFCLLRLHSKLPRAHSHLPSHRPPSVPLNCRMCGPTLKRTGRSSPGLPDGLNNSHSDWLNSRGTWKRWRNPAQPSVPISARPRPCLRLRPPRQSSQERHEKCQWRKRPLPDSGVPPSRQRTFSWSASQVAWPG